MVNTFGGQATIGSAQNAIACDQCAFLHDCGGIGARNSLFDWGCYSECVLKCNPANCDLTCPNNPELYGNRLAEIGGTFSAEPYEFRVPDVRLPKYVPKIHNGCARSTPLRETIVAVPARALLRTSGGIVSCRFKNMDQVRRHFCLSARCSIVISCIAEDPEVELVWDGLRFAQLAKQLAHLKPAAIIAPNLSFFVEDVPRIHTLYNRKRIWLAGKTLSDAGCRIILPLSSTTQHDWEFWQRVLEHSPTMIYVAKEFQTGLRERKLAGEAVESLAKLQSRLRRPLHIVAVGGMAVAPALRSHFEHVTVVESRPFVMTHKRRRALATQSGAYSEDRYPTAPSSPLDGLLAWNIKVRRGRLA